jgi:deoxyribodipyrimidine photo-lyase
MNGLDYSGGPVYYWMSRDQRVVDNWALLNARAIADSRGAEMGVIFCLVSGFAGAAARHYGFMLKGLAVTEDKLRVAGIVPFSDRRT